MSRSWWCVMNGRAVAPPAIMFIMGVSTCARSAHGQIQDKDQIWVGWRFGSCTLLRQGWGLVQMQVANFRS